MSLLVEEEMDILEAPQFVVDTLQQQADKINVLEEQNKDLLEQTKTLLELLQLSAETGSLIAKNLQNFMDSQTGQDEVLLEEEKEEE